MEIHVSEQSGDVIVAVAGKLDALTAPEYEQTLNRLIEEGRRRFVVDCDALAYISSAGLRALLATSKTIRNKGGKEVFANVKGMVREVFDMTGFSGMLSLHDSLAAALAAL